MSRLLKVMPRLPVGDLPRTIKFYTELLGFTVGPLWPKDAPAFAVLDRDDVCIQFYLTDSSKGEVVGNGTLSFEVDDATAMHGSLAGRVPIEWGPEVYWYGRRELAIRDPSGYLVIFSELTSEPPTCHDESSTMTELSSKNPTGRFTGLAETYARFRPSYPAHAIDFIVARCGLTKESLLVDVGCGTGIASRLFAARGINVIGIEPNIEMRCAAVAEPTVVYKAGRAEATGLAADVADAVLSAQAFHWFEPVATLREFHRILKSEGWAVLMWNERDERDPATAAFGEVIRTARDAAEIEGTRQARAGGVLRTSPLFGRAEQVTFHNQQALDEDGLVGRAFSASYAPRDGGERDEWADRLRGVFRQHQQDGVVVLRYRTSIYVAQQRGE